MSYQSLDPDTLVNFYAPFQPSSSTGWNESGLLGGTAAYFMSQGSEYRLYQPSWSIASVPASADVVTSLTAFTAPVITALEQVGSEQSQALADSLAAWITQVQTGTPVEEMTVTAALDHIRNTQGDDHATLTLLYVFCPPIGTGLLVQAEIEIDWAGTAANSTNRVITLFGTVDSMLDEPTSLIPSVLAILGWDAVMSCIEAMGYAAIVLGFVQVLGEALIALANDGGRANFLAVLAHAIHRISASTLPVPDEEGMILSVDPEQLGVAWYHTSGHSSVMANTSTSYLEGVYFGTYPDPAKLFLESWSTYTPLPYAPYVVGLPEMSWGTYGRTTLVTAKVFSHGENEFSQVYSVIFLLFGATGELLAISSAMQANASSTSLAMPVPAWCNASGLEGYGTGQVAQEIVATGVVPDPPTAQLEYVLPQLMAAIRDASANRPGDWRSAVQPATYWSVYWSDATRYDTGSHPSVTVRADGRMAESHSDGALNVSHLYDNYGRVDAAGNVTWSTTQGTRYDSGDWPALAVIPGDSGCDVLQIHSGGSNDIWWGYATIGDDGVATFSDGQARIGDGDHPAVAVRSDGVFVELHTTGAYGLAYGTGQFGRTGTLTMSQANQDYLSNGDYATVAMVGNTVIEVHNQGGQIWFILGSYQSDGTIAWRTDTYPYPTCPFTLRGTTPHLAVTSQGTVVLTYDDGDGNLCYATGELLSDRLVWHLLNGRVCAGHTPGLAATPSGGLLMVCAQGSNLACATGTVQTRPAIPGWPAGTEINGVDTTSSAPAACVFDGKLYVFWRGSNNGLFYSASTDGLAWPNGLGIHQQTTAAYPAACVLGNELFVFWMGSDSTGSINYCTTTDGQTWSTPATIAGGTTASPAACVFQNRLYVFWPRTSSPARIGYSVFDPGSRTWSGGIINDIDWTSAAVAACVLGDQLLLYWRQGDSSGHRLYVSASADGRSWPYGSETGQSSTTAPAACALGSTAYLFWTADDPRYAFLYCASETGTSWPWDELINSQDSTLVNSDVAKGCVGTAVFNDQLYLFWKGASDRIAYSRASA